MRIIQRSKFQTATSYRRFYEWRDCEGCGLSFDCDEYGNVATGDLPPAARENLHACETGAIDVVDRGVRRETHSWREPAIGLCDCGEEIFLDRFTNTCPCGADYNSAGQRLAPREQWGEETGEHWTECY